MIAGIGRPIVRHLSDLARESLKKPGSWRCLEIVYRNRPTKLLDRFFLGSRSARGARSRLEVLTQQICRHVASCAARHNPVRLISLGSGPGHEILGCVERSEDSVTVEGVCVDRDPEALAHGKSLAAQRGLSERIRYVRGNVLCLRSLPGSYDVAVLSGLLDYFGFDTAVSVLGGVRRLLLPGGIVLIANMRRHGLASTMSVLGNWNLFYREADEVQRMLAGGGYGDVDVQLEPQGVFCIGKGVNGPNV